MHRPYNVYFGLQDNDGWGGPSATRSRVGIRENNWFRVSFENSGDGFQTAVDPTDRHIVYSEAQDGRTVRTRSENWNHEEHSSRRAAGARRKRRLRKRCAARCGSV